MAKEAKLLGFDKIELSHNLSPNLLTKFYKYQKRNKQRIMKGKLPRLHISGVHNYCPAPVWASGDEPLGCEFTSTDQSQREQAIQLTKKSIDIAADLGGIYVVLPLGHAPIKDYSTQLINLVNEGKLYSKSYIALKLKMIQERNRSDSNFIDLVKRSLDELIPYAQKKEIRLGIESRSRYEQVPNEREMETLLEEYDTPTVGYWHDFGHVQLKENLGLLNHRQWLEKMLPRMIGCHLHDLIWPAEDHSVPFHGDIDFDNLIPLLPKNIPIVWEINPRRKANDIKAALINWKEKYGD